MYIFVLYRVPIFYLDCSNHTSWPAFFLYVSCRSLFVLSLSTCRLGYHLFSHFILTNGHLLTFECIFLYCTGSEYRWIIGQLTNLRPGDYTQMISTMMICTRMIGSNQTGMIFRQAAKALIPPDKCTFRVFSKSFFTPTNVLHLSI